jgi:hypothetical protein
MMEKYCTSLEVSKRLIEKGWKKETKFWWVNSAYDGGWEGEGRWYCDGKWYLLNHKPLIIGGHACETIADELVSGVEYDCDRADKLIGEIVSISAPLSAEILEELSNEIIDDYTHRKLWYWDESVNLFRSPDLLADCWIWAKEKGLIK